jgi:threonine aldolase
MTPDPPDRRFASDNNAGVHPSVLEAIERANVGHATAYGDHPWTADAADAFRELFGRDVSTWMVWGGTGANVMALSTLLTPGGAVVCSRSAHINVDETGAPERILGAKLIDVEDDRGRISPDQIREWAHWIGVQHHVQPSVLSITQSTEWGTLYTADEIGVLCDVAHSLGMSVHLDGARIANATAALGATVATLRSFTVDAGVDVVSFGGAKNGMMHGEAVVYLSPGHDRWAPFVRKQVTQLPSKVRYISAQFSALLADDLWIRNARHANEMAVLLHRETSGLGGVEVGPAPVVNSMFPALSRGTDALRDWSYFYDWDATRVRWMTSWDTTPADVHAFAAGVRHFVSGS